MSFYNPLGLINVGIASSSEALTAKFPVAIGADVLPIAI